ncbi:MAG: hypothetical protein J7M34_12130, partial [Anaerolineae bacterium]|nr:hypothetical protein [Anaerolineae bacterium]
GNLVIEGTAGRVVFRSGLQEMMIIDGQAQTILGLMYLGVPFGPTIQFSGGKEIRVANSDDVDAFVVRAGTDEDPNALYIQIGWSEPYSPKIIVTNDGLFVDAEALRGVVDLSRVTVDHGGLTGLEDDDHPQYMTRADDPMATWFYQIVGV